MTREEIIRNLKCTMEKHKNDTVNTFDTNISVMCKDILDYLEQEPKWIPVSERLPEESLNSVIGWDAYRERCVFVQYIDGYFQITGSAESFDIVAWMPLPKPYEPQES